MAIYHLSMKPVARASGRSAVATAAYRAGERLVNARDGLVHDFTRRSGVAHAEIVLPVGVEAEWAQDRSVLWNEAEAKEKRKDARVAREIELALPHELSEDQRLELTRAFARDVADRLGVAVDVALHRPHDESDPRNHHAHLLLTTRRVEPSGLGDKSILELENRALEARDLPTSHEQLRQIRVDWEERANQALARAGHDRRIDHRSHAERGLEIAPSRHMGVHATQMQRRGKDVSRTPLDATAARHNAAFIRARPEQVLRLITDEKSVFDRRDVARALNRAIDDPEAFQHALATVMASPALIEVRPEVLDARGRVLASARYSTEEMLTIEQALGEGADRLHAERGFAVAKRHVERAWRARSSLSEEQRRAVAHVTGSRRLAAAVGLAGAGKSTMLAAAREAWEAQGYRVRGAALAGKAAEGLEETTGIGARTLASLERAWAGGVERLEAHDVLIIDEAGMVSSRQLARILDHADQAGAKLVLVGDPEQLQPIEAGAAFRAVAERIGFVELTGVRRQKDTWQRQASVDFGRHRTAEALAAHAAHGALRFQATRQDALDAIAREAALDHQARPEGSRLVLAHRRADVRELNERVRRLRREQGALTHERVYETTQGQRAFAVGDRLVFLENSRALGVKNGMLGTVEHTHEERLDVRLDGKEGSGRGRAVSVTLAEYAALDHGYALTIHKAQGATVDRAFVLASATLDRHLTYVAMTRHREAVTLHAARDEFPDEKALAARLSRARAKETTLDYDQAGFARRRGIDPARAADRPGRFAGLTLGLAQDHAATPRKPGWFAGLRLPATDEPALAAGVGDDRSLARAVARVAKAALDIARSEEKGWPVLAHQRVALEKAHDALEALRPGAARDLMATLARDPRLAEAAAQGRMAPALAAMARTTERGPERRR